MGASSCYSYFPCGRFSLDMREPKVMGILNVTPDSFSDGGKLLSVQRALQLAEKMVECGADIIDVGGESTRPGATAVSACEEWSRLGPVLKQLVKLNIPVSVDTMKPAVMMKACDLGVDIINDVSGFNSPEALDFVKEVKSTDVGFCIMHMQGNPETMQNSPRYGDVVTEVEFFLKNKVLEFNNIGVEKTRILVDPGFGFGKTSMHNLSLLKGLKKFSRISWLLVGLSRKRLISEICKSQTKPSDRLGGSLAMASWALARGASIVRVHDVCETVEMIRVLKELN